MIRKLRSGKFWTKLIFFLSIAWFIIMSLGYAVAKWGLSDERIHAALQSAMPQDRQIQIDRTVERDWFPYPNVTLHNVRISYPKRSDTQIDIKEANIALSWHILLGQAKVKKVRLTQPQLNIARLPDNTWNIDDFYRQNQGAQSVDHLELIDGTLNVQETQHQYTLNAINASLQDWQSPNSDLHLAFNWDADAIGKQKIDLEGSIQKTTNGFNSHNVRVSIENTLPKIGKVTWLAQGQLSHTWLEHSSEFRNITLNGSDEHDLFKANLAIPQASWRKIWRIPQANGVAQWDNHDKQLTTATIKLGNTELSSQHIQSDNSSIDLVYKEAKETLSVKATGHLQLNKSGDFALNNWNISSRQTDVNLQTDALFRTDGVLNALGNVHHKWFANWDGSFDDDQAQIELQADGKQLELSLSAQHLDLERYQNWLNPASEQAASTQENLSKSIAENKRPTTELWLDWWEQLPKDWQMTGKLNVAELLCHQMQLSQVQADLLLNRDLFQARNIQALAYDGRLQGVLSIPRAEKEENVLQVHIEDMQIQPWLQHWLDYSRLSGTGSLNMHLSAMGNHWDDIRSQLNGELGFELKNGRFQGIALENLLHKSGNTNMQLKLEDGAETSFEQFKSHSKIQNGVFLTDIVHLDMPMALQLRGQGKYQLINDKLDYHLKFGPDLNANSALPIRITGSMQHPNLALDYQSLTKGLTNSVDKSNAVREALQRQWQLWQIPTLPLPKP